MTGLPADAEPSDREHEIRCRRASVVNMLAQLRGSQDMQDEAGRLALVVCGQHPEMRISDVFAAGRPVFVLPVDATPAEVDAALCGELEALPADDSRGP